MKILGLPDSYKAASIAQNSRDSTARAIPDTAFKSPPKDRVSVSAGLLEVDAPGTRESASAGRIARLKAQFAEGILFSSPEKTAESILCDERDELDSPAARRG